MSNFFINQAFTPISLETSLNLSAASVVQILYIKPNGVKGFWPGTVVGTTITYNAVQGDIDIAGNWRLQAYCIISGKQEYGAIVTQQFKTPLN